MNVEKTMEFILDNQAKFVEDLRSLQAEARNQNLEHDRQMKGIRNLVVHGMKMLAKNEEHWARNEERWAKNDERFKRLLDTLVRSRTNGGRR